MKKTDKNILISFHILRNKIKFMRRKEWKVESEGRSKKGMLGVIKYALE